MGERNLNIDLLKMCAILSVIILHSVPTTLLFKVGSPYHLWQCVPIFIILFSYNASKSYIKKEYYNLKQIYNIFYIKHKMARLILPFVLFWILEVIIQYSFFNAVSKQELFHSFIFGGWGPGSYFVPIVVQALLITPLIFLVIKHNNSIKTLFLFFLLSLLLEYFCVVFNINAHDYRLVLIRYIYALVLGTWFAFNENRIKLRSLCPLAILSLIYITVVNYYDYTFIMEKFWYSSHAPSYFYPLIIIAFVLKFFHFDVSNKLVRTFALIGKASYHIFLIQMLYFWSFSSKLPHMSIVLSVCINVLICVIAGILFFKIDNKLSKTLNYLDLKKY